MWTGAVSVWLLTGQMLQDLTNIAIDFHRKGAHLNAIFFLAFEHLCQCRSWYGGQMSFKINIKKHMEMSA